MTQRLLVATPHYYDAAGGGGYASLSPDRAARVHAVRSFVSALHTTLGSNRVMFDIAGRSAAPAGESDALEIDIVLTTARGRHLAAELDLPEGLLREHASGAEPRLLGFACWDVLRAGLGTYDWFLYAEDDLVVEDPLFVRKCAWFTSLAGPDHVLLPHRYETDVRGAAHKAYLDGPIRPEATARWRGELPPIDAQHLGRTLRFEAPSNPHAGCFLLSAAQMERFAAHAAFADRDTSFAGPLESAATLGVLRAFRVYKTAPADASFLEIRHAGTAFLSRLRSAEPGR